VSALVWLIDGDTRRAKDAFETALKRDPKDTKALLGLALTEIRLGNLQAAQESLQAAHDADPDNALVLTYLGRLQQQLGQPEAAKASWRRAELADPKDPMPWLYQAKMELQNNQPLDARDSLRQAQARTKYRSVYRGERLLREDEQLLQANLAEAQRQLGLENLAFHNLTDSIDERTSDNLRNQAEILQGQRFSESARHSLLLQSQFDDRPGSLPTEPDVYGDGAGLTGASTPQHGAVSGLSAQQASYNNYDSLFAQHNLLVADSMIGSQNSSGTQVRMGMGGGKMGLGVAVRQFTTDGNAPFTSVDNTIGQGTVQWRPSESTQLFLSRQTFSSLHGDTYYPSDPLVLGSFSQTQDNSQVMRVGLRQTVSDGNDLRMLLSHQQTDQVSQFEWMSNTLPYSNLPPWFGPTLPFPQFMQYGSSDAHSAEFEYLRNGPGYATQWGFQLIRGQLRFWDASGGAITDATNKTQQFYVSWQQNMSPYWQLDAGLARGIIDHHDNIGINSTFLARWLPKLGMVYTPDAETHVRLATWQDMNVIAVGDAVLAPVSLAGILLRRPGDSNELVHGIAFSADRQLNADWLLDGGAQRRKTDVPVVQLSQRLLHFQMNESRLALHWQPDSSPLIASVTCDFEKLQNDPGSLLLNSVNDQDLTSLELDLRWFVNEQWKMNLKWSHNQVKGAQKTSNDPANFDFSTILIPYQSNFNQLDAELDWRVGNTGSMRFGVRNATNASFKYMDTDLLNPRFSNGRLVYVGLRFAL
jgi:Tetratricopeptide repeat